MGDDDDSSLRGFEILSDETRVEILQALVETLRDDPEDPALGFSDLRRAVGMRDSGNFNYHLEQLEGRFVLATDDGYRIAPAGIRVVAALVNGVYGTGHRMGPVALDDACPVCTEPLSAVYEDNLFSVSCSNDHTFRNTLPPGAVDERTMDEVIDLLTITTNQHLELAVNGICPFCQGQLEWAIEPEERELPEFTNQCDRCGVRIEVPVIACVRHHPAVISFFYDHDIDVRNRPLWAPEFYANVTLEVTSNPVELEITIDLDEDRLVATLDGGLDITTIETAGPHGL